LLRNLAAIAFVIAAGVSGRAQAQTEWREYAYPDQQFAATFPASPQVARLRERGVTEVVYHLEQDAERFQVAVFDLQRTAINEATAIAGAAANLRQRGDVKLDIDAEVQGHWGHYLSFETLDGRRTIAAVFFRNERLYEIEASAPAAEFEDVSSNLVRFQQSLRFTGALRSRRFTPLPDDTSLQNLSGRLFGGNGTQR
jgi:hypothetical protein